MERAAEPDITTLLNRARQAGSLPTVGGQLLERYSSYLTLLACVQVGRRMQAKLDPADLVQETFLEAHRQFGSFRGTTEAELVAWLRRILAGQIAMMLRRYLGTKGRDVMLERELLARLDESSHGLGATLADSGSTPSQHVSRREQAVLLAEKLEQLPPDYREVIVLRNVEGLGFADVAARMQRSEDSVQKLWVRALARLQKALGEMR